MHCQSYRFQMSPVLWHVSCQSFNGLREFTRADLTYSYSLFSVLVSRMAVPQIFTIYRILSKIFYGFFSDEEFLSFEMIDSSRKKKLIVEFIEETHTHNDFAVGYLQGFPFTFYNSSNQNANIIQNPIPNSSIHFGEICNPEILRLII